MVALGIRLDARLVELPQALAQALAPSPPPRVGARRELRRLGDSIWTYVLRDLGLNEALDRVPEEFWQRDVDDTGRPIAIVACPCGESPVVPAMGSGGACECSECARFYLNAGNQSLWVTNTPKRRLWSEDDWAEAADPDRGNR